MWLPERTGYLDISLSSHKVSLAGDGTVLVLEADTPLEAAALLAAWCRGRSLGRATFVVPCEGAVLDAALARPGLATLGEGRRSRWRPALQVLPLRLALAFWPRDPLLAAELLLLPVAPLPRHARRTLLEALRNVPGIGSNEWNRAIDEVVEEEGRRTAARAAGGGKEPKAAETAGKEAAKELRQRIEAWFGGPAREPDRGILAAEASELCKLVADWASRRASTDLEADPLLLHAARVARTLQRLLAAMPPEERLTRVQLDQLHDGAVGAGLEVTLLGGEAGRPALCSSPALVLEGAAEVVWWGFLAAAEPRAAPPPWTEAERAALEQHGVRLPAPGRVRSAEAWGWRRPILCASESVVLARWRLSGADVAGHHPFEDDLRTLLQAGSLDACTVTSERALADGFRWPGTNVPVAASPRPAARDLAPRNVWRLPPETLEPRLPLSASSLGDLFGCPLTYMLKYKSGLRPGIAASISEGSRLVGELGHRTLQDMLLSERRVDLNAATPERAAAWAEASFDARIEREAAPLLRPGQELERARARAAIAKAAAALLRLLKDGGWTPRRAEAELEGTFAGQPIAGRADLLLERSSASALLDMKNSGTEFYREQLEQGRALQLALYAHMARGPREPLPATGYFVVADGELLVGSHHHGTPA